MLAGAAAGRAAGDWQRRPLLEARLTHQVVRPPEPVSESPLTGFLSCSYPRRPLFDGGTIEQRAPHPVRGK